MEHKTWLWRKKGSSEKTIVAKARASVSVERSMEEEPDKEVGSSRCPSNLSEGLASVICDCSAKDELIRKHVRIAEQALAGQEMAETEAAFLKQELEKALLQGEVAERRLAQLNAALKDCMQEIESLRGEQDERLHNVFSMATEDLEKAQNKLEGRLAESNKRVSSLAAENANLMKALLCKERLIEDLDKARAKLEGEFDMLMARLDSTEKENTFLKYECCVMEEELKLRNEEREYSRRSALESTKQINRLEAECQQLRNLVRKRLQGPAALLNTKNENDVRTRDQANMRKKRLNPTIGNSPEKPSKGTSFLIDRVYDMEEENKALREILSLSDTELQSWRIRCGQMASRLAAVEAQHRELSEGEKPMQLAISGFGVKDDKRTSDSESWAKALLAELEQFRKEGIKNETECEALAIVATGTAAQAAKHQLQSTRKELVLQDDRSCKTNDKTAERGSWLDEVLKVVLQEHQVSKRSFGELLQDIKIVVGCKDDMSKPKEENNSNISGLLPWKSSKAACIEESTLGLPSNDVSMEEKGHNIEGASFGRERIRKHFGFDRSKSENQIEVADSNRHNTLEQMVKIQSALQEENREIREKLKQVTEDNAALSKQLQESIQTVESLTTEVDTVREKKGVLEDQIENQRLINEDLNTQLTVAKAKMNETLHKLSSLEVELEDKNNCCEELETTCLELQLQLETLSRKASPNPDMDQVAKKVRIETLQNLGKQLKALASPDSTVYEKVLNPTTAVTAITTPSLDIKNLAPRRSSLRDRMLAEDDEQRESLSSPKTKEKANREVQGQELMILEHNDFKALPAPEPMLKSPQQVGTLAILPSKKPSGGFGFIRKLFLRRKGQRGCSKMKAVPLQRNTSALIGPREVLLVM